MTPVLFDYDENLTENQFYKVLHSHHEILLQAAGHENWIVCVPRAGSLSRDVSITADFVLRHILVEDPELSYHYTNLQGHNVIVDERQVVLVAPRTQTKASGGGDRRGKYCAVILFEELIYRTEPSIGLTKFRLWCLDRPIPDPEDPEDPHTSTMAADTSLQYYRIENFTEANKFLDLEFVKSKFVLQRVQKICHEFMGLQRTYPNVDLLHQTTKTLLNKIWSVLMSSNFYVKKLAKEDLNYAKMLRTSVEIYATHFINKFLLDQIAILEPSACEALNRKIVNLHESLKASQKSRDAALVTLVAGKLLEMENRTTVYDKLSWFREILKGISIGATPRSADEVLEILVDAMIEGRSMNWHPSIVLIKRFQFTESDNDVSERSYLVTTLEAAQQCILQEQLLNETNRVLMLDGDHTDAIFSIPVFDSKQQFLSFLFEKIRSRDEEIVLEMINLLTSPGELKQKLVAKDLCHPLCDCEPCQLKIAAETPTISSQDEQGNSCVHLVAMYGLVNAMRRILTEEKRDQGASLDPYHRLKNAQGETPLHVAAKYGQQNILLLLLHHDHGVNLNLVDMQGNTVLHLATQMGHLNCVKALLYFAEHKQLRALQVNAKNYEGDTSLHLAARSGFKNVVETLLEFTAVKSVKNNFGKTAADVAFSSAIRETIKDDSWDRVAVNHKLRGLEQKLDPQQVEMVVKSIERGDVNLALHYLKINPAEAVGSSEDLSVKYLDIIGDLDAEDRVNSCTSEGVYPIHVAMRCNNLLMVQTLVKYNVDFGVRTKARAETPFHWAVTAAGMGDDPEHDLVTLKYVFENVPNLDAVLNEADVDGETVLHLAVKAGNFRLIRMLLKFNVDFNATNKTGKDVITLAKELGWSDIADYMEYMRYHAGSSGSGSASNAESSSQSSQSQSAD